MEENGYYFKLDGKKSVELSVLQRLSEKPVFMRVLEGHRRKIDRIFYVIIMENEQNPMVDREIIRQILLATLPE